MAGGASRLTLAVSPSREVNLRFWDPVLNWELLIPSPHITYPRRFPMRRIPLPTIILTAGLLLTLIPASPAAEIKPKVEDGVAWYDVQGWGVEGRGWDDTKRYFDRLPGKAEGKVRPPVWGLSRHSAGMSALFATDATTIYVRYKLLSGNVAMTHMPATGVSGVDLYARDENGTWRWVAVTRPTKQEISEKLTEGLKPGFREYRVYLPLYNGTESLEIGVPEGAKFEPIPPRAEKPVVFYGTSILHGGCASRPGMAWPSIVCRALDLPHINLGFSGNGTMDDSIGALMAEIDAAAYVIDCLPNMKADLVAKRTVPLVKQLRAARPDASIILVEDRFYTNGWIRPAQVERNETSQKALREAYEALVAEGVKKLYYVEGDNLVGDDNEACVDGSHPSDLGMMRQAKVLIPVLKKALSE